MTQQDILGRLDTLADDDAVSIEHTDTAHAAIDEIRRLRRSLELAERALKVKEQLNETLRSQIVGLEQEDDGR